MFFSPIVAKSGSGLLPGIWVQGFARPEHLAGQRLRRRPDKCDAGCRRHKLHITRFRRCRRRKLAHSAAPPSAGALLGTVIKTSISHFFGISMCGGGITTLGPLWLCRNNPARGLFRQKNGFLRVGALCRRTRCSLLHTALFRRSCMGVGSLPSAYASCCRNAGRPRVTAAYLPFLCRLGICPVRAEYPLGGYTRHPSP